MNIAIVHEKCGFFGGVEQNVADSALGLTRKGHHCHLFYGTETGREVAKFKALFASHRQVASLAEHESFLSQDGLRGLTSLAPDVVYFHKIGRLAPALPLLAGVRTVRMIHDHDLCCPRRHKYFLLGGRVCHHAAGWRCWLDGAFLARGHGPGRKLAHVSISAKLAELRGNLKLDEVIVASRFMQDELVMNGYARERVHIVPPVVHLPAREPTPVPDTGELLYVGQLIRGKGVDLLLRALKLVRGEFHLKIVGEGNARSRLEKLSAKLGLSARVSFEGWVSHNDLHRYYERCRALIVPSRWPEPFGLIGLEAMAHARAVIAHDVGGIPDWLEPGVTGLLAGEQDRRALARAIDCVLEDRELAERLGRNGRERARAQYSFDAYLQRLESALEPEASHEEAGPGHATALVGASGTRSAGPVEGKAGTERENRSKSGDPFNGD